MAAERSLDAQQQKVIIPPYGPSENILYDVDSYRIINMVPKIQKDNAGNATKFLEKRTGFRIQTLNVSTIVNSVLETDLCAMANIGISQLNDVMVGVWYDASVSKHFIIQYRPVAGTVVKIGELAGATAFDYIHLSELQIGGVATLGLVWVKYDMSSSAGYYATSAAGVFTAGSLTEIFGTGVAPYTFPPKKSTPEHLTGPMVQMNGTTYVMTQQGKIYNSDLDSITSWNSLGVIQAIAYPDKGIGLVRYKHHIVAFGMDSTEFFNDVGNPSPASPLERTDQAFIKFGCKSPLGYVNVQDVLYWVGGGDAIGLWKLDGYAPVKVSLPSHDSRIQMAFNGSIYAANSASVVSFWVNKTHNIVINGAVYPAGVESPFYTSDDPVEPNGSVLDWFGILTYNIDADAWWAIMDCAYQGNYYMALYPATYYGSPTSVTYKDTQMIIKGELDNDLTSCGGFTYAKEYIYYNDSGVYRDYAIPADNADYNVVADISLPAIKFNTNDRKRISRFTINQQHRLYSAAAPSSGNGNAYIYVCIGHSRHTDVGVPEHTGGGNMTLRKIESQPASHRYYLNNLGMGREWNIQLWDHNSRGWIVYGFELDVAQGTH